MVQVLLPVLERHGRVVLDEATGAKLPAVSAATINCLRNTPDGILMPSDTPEISASFH